MMDNDFDKSEQILASGSADDYLTFCASIKDLKSLRQTVFMKSEIETFSISEHIMQSQLFIECLTQRKNLIKNVGFPTLITASNQLNSFLMKRPDLCTPHIINAVAQIVPNTSALYMIKDQSDKFQYYTQHVEPQNFDARVAASLWGFDTYQLYLNWAQMNISPTERHKEVLSHLSLDRPGVVQSYVQHIDDISLSNMSDMDISYMTRHSRAISLEKIIREQKALNSEVPQGSIARVNKL